MTDSKREEAAMTMDSYQKMLTAVQAFHDKHRFKDTGGEDMTYRVALMAEELGEIAECVTKGKNKEALAEECADLLILLVGTAISADFDLKQAFWHRRAPEPRFLAADAAGRRSAGGGWRAAGRAPRLSRGRPERTL